MPPGTEFGIDMKTYEVGPKFRGVSAIPLGLHFLYYGSGVGLRQGLFFRLSYPGEVIVKSWDPTKEELIEKGTGLPEGSMSNLLDALGKGQLNAQLGPYPQDQAALWRNLTNCVDESVLRLSGLLLETRILPGEDDDEALDHVLGRHHHRRRGGEEMQEMDTTATSGATAVVPYFPELGLSPRLIDVLGPRRPDNAMTPDQLTMYNLDSSQRLEALLRQEFQGNWKRFLGSIQLSFILFLTISSLVGLRHWKESVALLSGCREALTTRHDLFAAFVRILFTQVRKGGKGRR